MAVAFIAYAALALVLTFPLILRLSSVVPHDLGDPLLSTSILWWNAQVMPLTERWWNGFAFYPATGFMAYSDHRLGESLLATPLQWLGASPVTAYNLTLLATFPLCAVAAHWLAFTLTKRHDASTLCGLAYGFNPYRIAHIPHLELLAAFGMPVALVGLHQFVVTRGRRWLVLFAVALVLQGLCSSYYLLFFLILLALWTAWFLRPRDVRALVTIGIAGAAAALPLLPIAAGYVRVHRHFGFVRGFGEILRFSGDVTSLVTTSPLLLLWGWLARPDAPEGELFPGLTIVVLAIVGIAVEVRRCGIARDRLDGISIWLMAAAGVFAAIAVCAWTLGPWRIVLPGLSVSSEAPFKPMSLAVLAVAAAMALSSPVRKAYAKGSLLAFYVLATVVIFLCSLGPRPSLFHRQILYEPPYAWLMRLPIFGSVRGPARFAMVAILTLSVSGALAFTRLRFEGMRRFAVAIALMAAIAADGWIHNLAFPVVPESWPAQRTAGFAAVLELPLGDVYDDIAAMYRSVHHGRPVVNGNSGFQPTHYFTLKTALKERDPTALDAITSAGPVLIVVNKGTVEDPQWQTFLTNVPRVTRLADDDAHAFFAAAPGAPPPQACTGEHLTVATVSDNVRSLDVSTFTDGDTLTRWTTGHSQQIGDALVVDLGRVAKPCAVSLAVGEFRKNYARRLLVDTSLDGVRWNASAAVRTAGLTIRAALDDPKTVAFSIPLEPATARFLRLRIGEPADDAWVVAEISVTGARQTE
jgi:hypothetical protein